MSMANATATGRCECEHEDHFEDGTDPYHFLRRRADGTIPHRFWANKPGLASIKTSYGTFTQCEDCRNQHNYGGW